MSIRWVGGSVRDCELDGESLVTYAEPRLPVVCRDLQCLSRIVFARNFTLRSELMKKSS